MARFYRTDVGANARVSTEITGYSISTLTYLHKRTGQEHFLDAALRAARFLTSEAWDSRLAIFPFELGGEAAPCYFFDSGIIIRGLLSAWRASREAEYLDTAVACARSLKQRFAAPAGHFHPVLSLPDLSPWQYEPRWSRSPGCYQLKAALVWYELYEETGDREFLGWYEEALDSALETQASFLPSEMERHLVMDRLHAYCYFLEGALPRAERAPVARALAEGIERVALLLREIGPSFERSDVRAQLLRVRLFADAGGAVKLDHAAAAYDASRAASFQLDGDDPRISGGFAFGRRGQAILPYVNPVSTSFCIQALDLWQRHEAGEALPNRSVLI